MSQKQLLTVPISQVRENPVALRPVDPENEDYKGLVESIRKKGLMGVITVREQLDEETNELFYQVVDGLHRFAACKEVGLEEISISVEDLDDKGVLEAQIMANIHKVETKPVQYAKQLHRLLSKSPLLTSAELAASLGKSPTWINQRLGIAKIENVQIQELIEEGKISLSNAFALSKLPPEDMPDWIERAMTMTPDEFIPKVNERLKEIRAAARKGDKVEETFTAVPHLQKVKDMKDEFESNEIGAALIASTGASTAVDGFKLGIAWALHMDPESQKAQETKWTAMKAAQKTKKEQKAKDKAKDKADDLEKKAKEARIEADKVAAEQAAAATA